MTTLIIPYQPIILSYNIHLPIICNRRYLQLEDIDRRLNVITNKLCSQQCYIIIYTLNKKITLYIGYK